MSEETVLQVFVSSPADVQHERERIDAIVERLDDEYAGRVRIRTIRWETRYYSSHDTFQAQIPEAADCDLVVAIFGARLGSPLPEAFPPMPSGERYPSGTAYEILTAMEARRQGRGIPDIYVFRRPTAPLVALDAADRAEVESQWQRLTAFFETWFRNPAGEFLAAFQEFGTTDDFAVKVEECLRQWLTRRGFPPETAKWDRARLGSPYPGLDAFDEDRQTVFFGRSLAVRQVLGRLRDVEVDAPDRVPFVLLIGASGSGKSSLLRAGVMPKVGRPGVVPEIDLWRRAVVVPGRDPFASLAEALLGDDALGPELRQTPFADRMLLAKQLAADPDVAAAPLATALAAAAQARCRSAGFDEIRPARLLLAIDQAERLLTETPVETQTRFAALLARLCRRRIATVVMVLRSDAYPLFQAIDDLVALRTGGATLDLTSPTTSELEEMATGPAAMSTPPLVFERRDGDTLAARLIAEARGGDALPLMQMTLARLAAAEERRGDGVLRFHDYHGLGEAVSLTAAAALDGLDAAARGALSDLVVGLVRDWTVDPASGRPAPVIGVLDRARFEAGRPERRALVESFVAHRLLTAEGDAADGRVRPTHESLLRIWPEAVAILEENAHLVRARAAIEPLARDWVEAAEDDRARHLAVSPALLEAAVGYVARFGEEVPETTRRFVAEAEAVAEARREAERAAQERRIADAEAIARARGRVARATGIGLAVALILAAVAAWQWQVSIRAGHEAERQRDRAEHTLAAASAAADGLVFDLAQKFRNVSGVPKSVIRDILEQARRLQEQLISSGEKRADLDAGHAAALGASAQTEQALGDLAAALDRAKQSRDLYAELARAAPDAVRLVHGQAYSDDLVGSIEAQLGHAAEAEAAWARAEATLEAAIARGVTDPRLPQLLALILEDSGTAARLRDDGATALAHFRRSLALTEGLLKDRPGEMALRHNVAVAHRNIGDVVLAAGSLEEADAEFRAASDLAAALTRESPTDTLLRRDFDLSQERLGEALTAKGDFAGALKAFTDGQTSAFALAASDPGNLEWQYDLAIGHREIGDTEWKLKNPTGAAASFRRALAIDVALISRDPSNELWRRHSDDMRLRLALVLEELGDRAGAATALRDALAFARTIVDTLPDDLEWRTRAMQSARLLGAVLTREGDEAGARDAFEAALTWARGLPVDRAGRLAVSDLAQQLAAIAALDGDTAAAGERFDEADRSLRAALAADPGSAEIRGRLVGLLVASASTVGRLGRHDDAVKGLHEAIDLCRALAAETPGDHRWIEKRAVAEDRLGDALAAAGDRPGAIAAYRASLAIAATLGASPSLAGSVTREALVPMLEAEGHPDEALAVARDAVADRRTLAAAAPDDPAPRRALLVDINVVGRLLAAAGRSDEALTTWREGLALARAAAASPNPSEEDRRDLALSLFLIGAQIAKSRDTAGATAALAEALSIAVELNRKTPPRVEHLRFAGMVGRSLALVRSTTGDRPGALDAFLAARTADDAAAKVAPADASDLAHLKADVDGIGAVAISMLLNREFEGALASIDRAGPLAPDRNGFDLVRGIALMFLDRTDEAAAVFARHRGETTASGRPFELELRDAFDRLREHGLVHPLMKELGATRGGAP